MQENNQVQECTKYQKHVNNLGKLKNSVHNQRYDWGFMG